MPLERSTRVTTPQSATQPARPASKDSLCARLTDGIGAAFGIILGELAYFSDVAVFVTLNHIHFV